MEIWHTVVESTQRLSTARPAYVAGALALYIVSLFIVGARWRGFLRALGGEVGVARATVATLGGIAVGNLTPSSKVAGEACRIALVRMSGHATWREAAIAAVWDRLSEVPPMLILAGTAAFALRGLSSAWQAAAGVAGLVGALVAVGLGVRQWHRSKAGWRERLALDRVSVGVFSAGVAYSTLLWLQDVARLTCVALALGVALSPVKVATLSIVAMLGGLVPTMGGLGAVEGGLVAVLVAFGVDLPTAAAITAVERLISYGFSTVAGSVVVALMGGRSLWTAVRRRGGPPAHPGPLNPAAMPSSDSEWGSAARFALAPWFVTRLAILIVGFVAAMTIGYDPLPVEQAAWRESSSVLLNLPARWDAYWYLDIVRHGYRWDTASPVQQNVVYFPAYPALITTVSRVTGAAPLLAGLLISLAAFYFALTYLRRLARLDLDESGADRAVWLIAAYPLAMFFGAVYTESLFLLAIVGAFWHARRQQWVRTAAWGLVAGLTRPNGCVVAAPLAVLVALQARPSPGHPDDWTADLRLWWQGLSWPGLVAACAPVLGALIYSGYLGAAFGDPLAWVKGQTAWGTLLHPTTPSDPRWPAPPPALVSNLVHYAADVAAVPFALGAIRPIWKRFGVPYAVLVLVSVIPPLLTHGPLSFGRFTSVQFPLFLWLAAGPAARRTPVWLLAFAAGQVLAAVLYYSWRVMV